MKKSILLFAASLLAVAAAAQSPEITIEQKANSDYSVDIIATKYPTGTYSVAIMFDNLQNTHQARKFYGIIRSRQETLLKIKPAKAEESVGYSMLYWSLRGIVTIKPNTEFVYRLPYSAGKKATARSLGVMNKDLSSGNAPEGWRSVLFELSQGDTVFATRRGLVVEVIDNQNPAPPVDDPISFRSNVNQIIVEHMDGSYMRYSVLEKGSITVKEGDIVYPDTPLGLAGSYGDGRYRLHLLMWSVEQNKQFSGKLDENPFHTRYLDPVFLSDLGTQVFVDNTEHTAVVTDELITKEMPKREQKDRSQKPAGKK